MNDEFIWNLTEDKIDFISNDNQDQSNPLKEDYITGEYSPQNNSVILFADEASAPANVDYFIRLWNSLFPDKELLRENLFVKNARVANILDPVHDHLDQDVFNGTTPKKEFFDYHMDHIKEVFRQYGFNPHAFDFYLTGSLCTYQYSKTSDVDISIVCNVNEFSDKDRADLISIVVNSLDGEFFPRTQHQYQHFVQPLGVEIEDLFVLGLRGAWDFQTNKWVLKPARKRAHDISKEKPDWIVTGLQISDKINSLIDNNNEEEAKELYKQIHQRRKEDQIKHGDYSEGNIIYKLLDNNGTFDRLKNIGQKIASEEHEQQKPIAFYDMPEEPSVTDMELYIESIPHKETEEGLIPIWPKIDFEEL